jgi:hypothetical protein
MPKPHQPMSRRHPLAPRVNVKVLKEYINTAIRGDSSHCMGALGVEAALPYKPQRLAVDLQTIRWTDPALGLRYVYLTPRVMQEALLEFDEGINPDEFTFTLRHGQVTRAGNAALRAKKARAKAKLAAGDPVVEEKKKKSGHRLPVARQRFLHGVAPNTSQLPHPQGGRRPPQLRLRREFGLRAFRGASARRKAALAATEE